LLDCVSGTTYLSTYVILSFLSWSSAVAEDTFVLLMTDSA